MRVHGAAAQQPRACLRELGDAGCFLHGILPQCIAACVPALGSGGGLAPTTVRVCRSEAPLPGIAQLVAGLFENVDLSPSDITPRVTLEVRAARTQHLVSAFGISGRFERSDTGMPERHTAGRPPSSIHTNAHACIVREWVQRDQDQRRAIVEGGAAREEFVGEVLRRLCVQGRGDVFNAQVKKDTDELLPSFFEALAAALRAQGKSGEDVAVFEHDFAANRLQDKIVYELTLEPERGELS